MDAHGNACGDTIGFDFPGGEPAPGSVVLAAPDGAVHLVAGDLAFPNGMAITADGVTRVVAESYASRLTAYEIGHDGDRHCVRVREGGEVLAPVGLDRGAFACALSHGDQPRLCVVGQEWGGPQAGGPTGQVVAFPAPAPGGRP